MTSRSFCSKEESRLLRMMTKEKMRRSLWAISLCTLAFFFMLTVPTIMGVQQGLERRKLDPQAMESIYSMLSTIVGRHNVFVTLATVAMAVLLAAVSFRYMHNKKQVDFYHSLPIRRPWLFLANFLAGMFGFLFAYLLNLVLSLGIIFCSGFGKALSGPQVLGTMALHLVFFPGGLCPFHCSTPAGGHHGHRTSLQRVFAGLFPRSPGADHRLWSAAVSSLVSSR